MADVLNDTSSVTDEQDDAILMFERYRRLIEISQELTSNLNLKTLLNDIISAAQELTQTDAASILLIDPITGELRFEIASNINTNTLEEIVVPMEGSIAGWIVTHGEPRVIEDVLQDPDYFSGVDESIEFQTRNLLGVPMRARNKVIGVLEAVNKQNGARFDHEDIRTLTTLASQAAIAIENARLFQQSDFIAEMVHELRTPLAALKASTVLLKRPDLPEDRRDDIIDTMQGETERLIRMTSDFLDVARLESGRTRIDAAPFRLQKLIRECIEVVMPQANDRGVSIDADKTEFNVNGDRGKVKQVLLNLLTNAIKYNRDDGHIHIHLTLQQEQDQDFVEIAVADTGQGISKADQKNLFQKFYRVADTAGYTQGTGLGLTIAKHIVEAHNGHIWVTSEKGVGSTFFFTLPILIED
ncbi:MAG: GAF domain-containing protein [Chloroflexi bacterium]|nr:MAG: hypothetical protein CUN54_00410 [Phototrophicales bacterium]RMF79318.1 MAG: GAF domain-containing protein [Chloroflexota bacterium]